MCPIGKYYKAKCVESTDSKLKPIPGSNSYKVNQICYYNYLPLDQHYCHHNRNLFSFLDPWNIHNVTHLSMNTNYQPCPMINQTTTKWKI